MKELVISDQFKYWPICSIAWYATRENLMHASLATWYKYVKIMGLKSHRITKKKRYPQGITASTPNEKWHADITIVKTLDGIKNYVYLLMDNYSRYIINWRVEPVVSGKIRVETIKEAYQQNTEDNKNVDLIIDGGPENNNGEMDKYLCSETINISKLIAMKDIPYSNSLIEAQNKLIKYWYLFKCHYNDIDELRKVLDWIIYDYNNKRPHNSLRGLTPNEAYNGRTFDITAIKLKTEQAKQKRLIENRKNQCEICK
jgi:putative transposase